MSQQRYKWLTALGLLGSMASIPMAAEEFSISARKTAVPDYRKEIQPLLDHYCYACHGEKKKGDLDLRVYRHQSDADKNRTVFEKVLKQVRTQEMPPEGKIKPSERERERLIQWIESVVFKCDCKHPDPGRVTIRRLNRTEYNNTIHDLLGVDLKPAEDFPADDIGYGFDNIGDVLTLPPVLLERYLAAAEKILQAAFQPQSSFHNRYLASRDKNQDQTAAAQHIISSFARRAYRRVAKPEEIQLLLRFFDQARKDGDSFEQSLQVSLKAILVSPHFLFRSEVQVEPNNPTAITPLDEYALASRLSYFIWSSMPDDILLDLCDKKLLRKNLETQVRRMMASPKADALTQNFSMQWLQLARLQQVTPDRNTFPAFSESLRDAMGRETEMFFQHIQRDDRSILDFLAADYTFANEELARHYGLRGVTGEQFRKVSLRDTPRGGVLSQASILTLTSNPTRTSPVKRGKWVLDNILGAPPPPPPPNVPELKDQGQLRGTVRQRLEQHRADPACANCHARMDPIGFAFENYDGIGSWRTQDGSDPLDTTGKLVSGESFKDAQELKTILLKKKRDEFVRCLTEKMLTYALGRGLEYYDKCALDEITTRLAKGKYKFSTLVLEVVRSVPFQYRRGETVRSAQTESR